ncbi:hypothetical protein DM02DRAFT_468953, partial [Periconia macrospinosa]
DDDDDVSTTPFAQQPAFGRGLWKRPVKFVPAGSASKSAPPVNSNGKAIADAYRAIVFGKNGPPKPELDAYPLCGTCGAPVKESDDKAHYLSHVHQAALPRAPIPSGIDRTRMGLKYLEKHGFDIDARVGLGANGQGMLFPIVPKEKRDKVGLGVDLKRIELEKKEALTPKNVSLDASKVRKLATEQKKKHERLQKMFYGDDKVEAYL